VLVVEVVLVELGVVLVDVDEVVLVLLLLELVVVLASPGGPS
jgi:hypothetical protein